MTKKTFAALCSTLILLACSGTPVSPDRAMDDTSFLDAPKTCAILYGTNSTFSDPQIQKIWQAGLTSIMESLSDGMKENGYRIAGTVLPTQANGRALLMESVVRHRCARVIQVSQEIDTDAQGAYVAYQLTHFKLVRSEDPNSRKTSLTSLFQKTYRYKRDMAFMNDFSFSAFSEKIFLELRATRTLQGLN